MSEITDLNDSAESLFKVFSGDCSSFVLFAERKIDVWVVSVLVVFGMRLRVSACSGRI